MSANSTSTSGLAQLRSHCHSLNVVHTHACELVVPGEVARREVGEDLRQRLLERVGEAAVGVDVEVVAVRRVPGAGAHGPVVLAGDVVEDQVEHQADAAPAQRGGELAQVVDRAEVGAHGAVVLHGVAAVVVAVAGLQQRHQVQVGDAERPRGGRAAWPARAGRRRTARCSRRSRTSAAAAASRARAAGAGRGGAGRRGGRRTRGRRRRPACAPRRRDRRRRPRGRRAGQPTSGPGGARTARAAPRRPGPSPRPRSACTSSGARHRLHSNACGQEAPCGDAVS